MNNRQSKPGDAYAGSGNDAEGNLIKKAAATGPAKRIELPKKTERVKGKQIGRDKQSATQAQEVKEAEHAEEVEKAKDVDEEIEALDEGKDVEDLEAVDRLKRKYMVLRFWQAARRFWTGHGWSTAWLLTGGLLAVIVLNIAAAYAMNVWNRNIFDALENRDAITVVKLSVVYLIILAISVVFAVAQVYVRMTLQRRWRKWLTDNLMDRWLKSGRYYQLNLISGDHENPEYRIADDVR